MLLLSITCLLGGKEAENATDEGPSAAEVAFASKVDSLMQSAVTTGMIPGGVVCVVTSQGIVFEKAYGFRQLTPDTLPMTTGTAFDLASLSKPVGTAMAVMTLAKEGEIDLNAPVRQYIPQFKGEAHVVHLLTHTSGLPAYMNADVLQKRYGKCQPQALLDTICRCRRPYGVAEKENYSCLNYIVLQHIVEAVSGEDFDKYVTKHVFEVLGMKHTMYGCCKDQDIAATEILRGEKLPLCGVTHDPLARVMNGGVSGNAGVFSTAGDLALLARFMLLHKEEPMVREMTHVPDSLQFSRHTLGWGKQANDITYMGTLMSNEAYAHTGYTGTLMAIDPLRDVAIILLTNRVHPTVRKNINPLRAAVCDAVIKSRL